MRKAFAVLLAVSTLLLSLRFCTGHSIDYRVRTPQQSFAVRSELISCLEKKIIKEKRQRIQKPVYVQPGLPMGSRFIERENFFRGIPLTFFASSLFSSRPENYSSLRSPPLLLKP